MRFEIGETFFRGGKIAGFRLLDQRTDPINPLTVGERAAHGCDHFIQPAQRDGAGFDLLAASRLFAELRYLHVAEIRQNQRARYRRRRQSQYMHFGAQLLQALLMANAEMLFFIDNDEPQILE